MQCTNCNVGNSTAAMDRQQLPKSGLRVGELDCSHIWSVALRRFVRLMMSRAYLLWNTKLKMLQLQFFVTVIYSFTEWLNSHNRQPGRAFVEVKFIFANLNSW